MTKIFRLYCFTCNREFDVETYPWTRKVTCPMNHKEAVISSISIQEVKASSKKKVA